jgi:RNA polymerase sigma-70 factor (sigma-E family)
MVGTSRRDREFSEYVLTRRSRLVGTAYLLCGDRHTAEDLVQTALAKLYVAWPRIHRSGGPDAYARRILVNAGIDASRRPWRREHSAAEVPEVPAAAGFGTEERDELVAVLAALPPAQRRVIVLRYWSQRPSPRSPVVGGVVLPGHVSGGETAEAPVATRRPALDHSVGAAGGPGRHGTHRGGQEEPGKRW